MTIRKTLFSFQGRIGRVRYVLGALVPLVLQCLAWLMMFYVPSRSRSVGIAVVLFCLFAAIALIITAIWQNYALVIKRLHDMNAPGGHAAWMTFAAFVAFNAPQTTILYWPAWIATIGGMLWVTFFPGSRTTNQYGDPAHAAPSPTEARAPT